MLAGNAYLSYADPSPFPYAVAVLAGVLLPAFLAYRRFRSSSHGVGSRKAGEILPPAGWIVVLLVLGGALFIRLHKLSTLSAWPIFDEGVYSYNALEIIRGGTIRFFSGNSQVPPMFVWTMALVYKIWGVSLATLWFVPALFSFLYVPAAWWAARQWLSRSGALAVAFMAAFSFWPQFLGRYSVTTVSVLPLQALAFGALGLALHRDGRPGALKRWVFFGVVLGAGFYTHLHWLAIAPVLVLTALAGIVLAKRDWKPRLLAMAVPVALLWIPIVAAARREGFGDYLWHLWVFKQGSFDPGAHLLLMGRYLAAFFWGVDPEHCTYQPVWGGILNPVLGALALLGAGVAVKGIRDRRHAWSVAAFLIWLMPGFLTKDLEIFRLMPVIPVLFLWAWMGFKKLAGSNAGRNAVIAIVLAVVSLSLDTQHVFGAFERHWENPRYWEGHTKSLARARAYRDLEKDWRSQGPGLVYSRFVPGLPDCTLEVATYEYNAVDNPALDAGESRWAAFLVNANYGWYLRNRYGGAGRRLDDEGKAQDGGWVLWTAPVSKEQASALAGWTRVHRAMADYWLPAMSYVYGTDYARFLPALEKAFAEDPGDPLLASLLAEIRADALFKAETLGPSRSRDPDDVPFRAVADTLEEALKKGPPFAHLYYRLGQVRLIRGESDLAKRAFEKALKCPENHTEAERVLKAMAPDPLGP